MTTRLLALTTLAVLAAASAALGFWPAVGSGSGSAGVGSSTAQLTIAPAAPLGQLLPTGSPSAGLTVTIANANAFPVHIGALELDPTQGSAGFSPAAAACALTFSRQDNAGAGWDVPASGSISVALPGSVSMGTAAADSCQGQSFSVYLRAA